MRLSSALLVAATLLVACSSDDTDPSSTSTTTTTNTTATGGGGTAGGGAASAGGGGSGGVASVPIVIEQALIDDAAEIPVPSTPGEYAGGGGSFYGRNGPVMLFLAIAGRNDESLTSTGGVNIRDRAVEHMKAAVTPGTHPLFVGGHAAWFDLHVPLALAIGRQTPSMWAQLSDDEKRWADILMEHCLYVGTLFCNTNSTDPHQRARVQADMHGNGAGSLPNQSASFHTYAIGAYVYFGGTSAINPILAAYDLTTFRGRLQAEGFTDIDALYANPAIQGFFEGVDQGGGLNPDPLGVRKPFDFMNTSSLEGSPAGEEHRYHAWDPVPAKPAEIFMRWGNDWAVGAVPLSNVGPDVNDKCGGIDFGLASGTMPYESDGKGMPFEFNARGSAGGPHNRSSWDYSKWGMQQYMYMLATVAILGYWDAADPIHQAALDRARRAVEIIRYVGEHKWVSSAGPPAQICTSNHGDAYGEFSGSHWAQGMMDAMLFSGADLPYPPVVP